MKGKKLRKIIIGITAAAVIVSGLSLAGCGSKEEAKSEGDLDKLTVQSLWLPQGQFAGLYVAKEKGY